MNSTAQHLRLNIRTSNDFKQLNKSSIIVIDKITIHVSLCVFYLNSLIKFSDKSQKLINAKLQIVFYRKRELKSAFNSRTFKNGLCVKDGVSKKTKNEKCGIVNCLYLGMDNLSKAYGDFHFQ